MIPDPNMELQKWKRSTIATPPLTMVDWELIIAGLSNLATEYRLPTDIVKTRELNLILRLKQMLPEPPNFWED